MIKFYIWVKCFYSFIFLKRKPYKKEIDDFQEYFGKKLTMEILKKNYKITYRPDKLFFLPFDWQYGVEEIALNGGGDCNSLNWLIGLSWYLHDYAEYYLLSYRAGKLERSHALIIRKENSNYSIIDYGIITYTTISMNEIFRFLRAYRDARSFCLQTLDLKIV